MHKLTSTLARALLALSLCGCLEERATPAPVVFADDVADLLQARCVRCHGPSDAGAGYRVDSYLGVLGCGDDDAGQRAVDEGPQGRAILQVLAQPDHAGLLSPPELARLRTWLARGMPVRQSAVHSPYLLDSRSKDWHGKLAAADRFGPLLDPNHAFACGRCHAGAPATPSDVQYPAPGAPDCTSCHTHENGVLACVTCHGDGVSQVYPPRDACLFGPSDPDAHAAHVHSTRLSSQRIVCGTCHPPANAELIGTHANGIVDVVFDPNRAGDAAHYDPRTAQCTVACHNQGGARSLPSFHESGPLGCGDCHGAPPSDHYAGPCQRCHVEANADGTALQHPRLHMNGRVDLGDGSGDCSACHGQNGDPMPLTPSHLLHRNTQLTYAISCADCHVVPSSVDSPGHLDKGEVTPADVVFGARASARGQQAVYDHGTCRNIACHGAGLPEGIERALVWDSAPSGQCAGCHGLPPTKSHTSDTTCASAICHGSEVSASQTPLMITTTGRALHINGVFDVAKP